MSFRNPSFVWRALRFMNRRVATRVFATGGGPNRLVLLLTTTGRKSGLPRVTPLQFEEIDGVYYIGSARGAHADWFRNIVANPCVEVQVQQKHSIATAEPITDAERIADFLELRLQRHPVMIRAMLLMHGLFQPKRANIERLASTLTLVVIRPKKLIIANQIERTKSNVEKTNRRFRAGRGGSRGVCARGSSLVSTLGNARRRKTTRITWR